LGVYLLASGMRGTLYVGVTSDLAQRIWQRRNEVVSGFSKQHHVHCWSGMRSMT